LHSYACGGFDVGGDLCIQFLEHIGIKCYAVVSGQGWLLVEGVSDPVQLRAGDCFLLPRGLPFCLASELGLPPFDIFTARTASREIGYLLAGDAPDVLGPLAQGGV